jgi:multidrug efflux pump subunit AcrB
MRISHKAIDRPRVVIVSVILVIALALLVGYYIPIQRTPAINTAVILVAVAYPGAQPTEVEEEITRKIEEALERLNDVDFIASLSMRGSSVTQVIFLDGVDADRARDDVAHLVDEVRALLPAGREVQPIITSIDFESAPIMLVNLAGPKGFDERALKQVAEDVQQELETISGVANTQLFGGREREVHVNVNPDLFFQYGLAIDDIRTALMSYHSELPGGSTNTGQFDYQVRNETKYRTADDIRKVVVAQRQGRLIRIDDIAEVRDTYRRLKNLAQLDGKNTATVIVNKEANINSLQTARAIKARVDDLRAQYPHIEFSTTRDVSQDIRVMFQVLGGSAAFGAVLILIILTLALGVRISVLVLTAIPFSTAIGMIFLFWAGIPLSNMVIFSFILVLGIVVDGAIIVAENIHRHIERGELPVEAAKIGIDEVGIPVIAADLTTVAAFLPMILVPGIMGDFMGVMPKVVSVALLGSVLVDHFLIPVLAAYWYKRRKPKNVVTLSSLSARSEDAPPAGILAESDEGQRVAPQPITTSRDSDEPNSRLRPNLGLFARTYAAVLRYALGNRWVVIACCFLSFVWARVMLGSIGFDFFPASDRGQFEINYELPLGYSIEQTLAASESLTEPLLKLQDEGLVEHFVTAVGSSAGLATRLDTDPVVGPEFGKIMVQLAPPTERDRHQNEIIRQVREEAEPLPGMIFRIEELQEGPPGGADVAVRLTGDDLVQLGRLARKIEERLEQSPKTLDVSTDYRPDSPELVVEPYPELAGLFDLDEAQVARAVQTAILGDSTIQLTIDDEDVTLRLQADPDYQKYPENIRRLMLTSPSGRKASVGQLAEIRRSSGLYTVNRYQRRRAVVVRCDVRADQGFKSDDVFADLRDKILPEMGFRPVEAEPQTLLGEFKAKLVERGMDAFQQPATTFLGNPITEAEGVRATFTGENEERDENFEILTMVMLVGVLLIFAVLVIQFNSFRQTLVVLMAVPLSFVGVVLGMWICRQPFSLASFIGLVALAGIVVNDAIVLVDFANQARRRGLTVKDALMEAGINRLRPVLLTTVTTICGLLPLFLNFSGGAEFWQPLTGAIIFGLVFATVLTLIVVPVCYSLAYSRVQRRETNLDYS